jgi:hypothetical protein
MRPTGIAIALWAALAGCGGGEAPAPAAPEPAAPATPANPETPSLDLAALQASSEARATLVPSPIETQNALEAIGVDASLAKLVPTRTFDLTKAESDHIAIRTGVVLADTLLTLTSADKDTLIARLEQVRTGLAALKAGADLDGQLAQMIDGVRGDAITRGELLKQFDDLSGAVIPELEFEGNTRIVPLIQAGSWLSGANLVAKAVQAAGNPAGSDSLLKQPGVVSYFLTYVKAQGADKAPPQVTAHLQTSLETLQGLATKAEPLTPADIATVIQVTDDVVGLL